MLGNPGEPKKTRVVVKYTGQEMRPWFHSWETALAPLHLSLSSVKQKDDIDDDDNDDDNIKTTGYFSSLECGENIDKGLGMGPGTWEGLPPNTYFIIFIYV